MWCSTGFYPRPVTLPSICINGIHLSSKLLKFILFADDTNVLFSNADLTVNIKKTMFFLRCAENNYPFIRINNETFKHKTYSTFLGIYVDENLNWKEHVNLIANRVFKSIGIISKARFYLCMPSLSTLYFAFVYILTCNMQPLFGALTYKTTLNRPLVLQKRIRRVNTKSCFDAPNPISDGSLLLTSRCLRWLDTVFQGQFLPSLSINYVAINKVLEKLPPQLY